MKGYLLITIIMLCQFHTTKDIEMNIESYSYVNGSNGVEVNLVEYSIRNLSEEPYYTWIDFNDCDERRGKRIYEYFFIRHRDVNLATLMTDNVVLTDYEMILGETFIKRLDPQESFKYIVAGKKENDNFEKKIIVEKASDIRKVTGFDVPEFFEFSRSELVVL